jgi:hypothetical protein
MTFSGEVLELVLGALPGTGCGAAWLARLTGGQEVPGSNPGSPTIVLEGPGTLLCLNADTGSPTISTEPRSTREPNRRDVNDLSRQANPQDGYG